MADEEHLEILTLDDPIHLELVRIPAGEFLMGSDPAKDKDAKGNEQPQHRVYVSEFYIAKYPVTNGQYAAWKGHDIPSGKENHPVVDVSWDDAVAFCAWLSQETGKSFRLPTEAEWEKVAREVDGRLYPWGDVWDKDKCNTDKSGIGDTTPVGEYSPAGDSPYGCADMAGNVWEWCADWWDKYEYRRRVGNVVKDPKGAESGEDRVLRGGSFYNIRQLVRCAFRYNFHPFSRSRYRGFRVRVSVFQ